MEKEHQVKLEEEQAKVRKAKADADYYETTKKAEADTKIEREKGLAEAEVIRQKGAAEAEAKKLLAQAIAEHGEVIIIEKLIEMLPQYAEKIAQPLANIDSVKIVDTGNGNGVNAYSKSVTDTLVQVQEPLKELTGIDIATLLKDLVNRGNTHTTVVVPETKGKSEKVENKVEETLNIEDLGEKSETPFGLIAESKGK